MKSQQRRIQTEPMQEETETAKAAQTTGNPAAEASVDGSGNQNPPAVDLDVELEEVEGNPADSTASADAAEATGDTADMAEVKAFAAQESPEARQIEELTGQLLRARADFDNFRRRSRQEKEELQQFATKKLLEELLPVVDNFERALAAFSNSADTATDDVAHLKTGLEMVHRQLLGVLEQEGVQPIDALGQPFNPNFHQAVMQEEVEGEEPGKVIAELQKGYILHSRVLRPAMVKVTS